MFQAASRHGSAHAGGGATLDYRSRCCYVPGAGQAHPRARHPTHLHPGHTRVPHALHPASAKLVKVGFCSLPQRVARARGHGSRCRRLVARDAVRVEFVRVLPTGAACASRGTSSWLLPSPSNFSHLIHPIADGNPPFPTQTGTPSIFRASCSSPPRHEGLSLSGVCVVV